MSDKQSKVIYILAALCLCGIAISAFLVYEYTAVKYGPADYSSFCNISESFNCDKVASSKWSTMAGIPVASYGLAFYLALFFFALLSLDRKLITEQISSSVFGLFSFLSLLMSLVLFALSKFAIGSFCLLCMGLYLVNILMFICSLKLASQVHFTKRLLDGTRALLDFPLLALGLGRFSRDERRPLVESGLLGLFVCCFCAYSLPYYFVGRFISPPGTPLKLKQQPSIAQALKDWINASPVNFKIQSDSPLNRDYQRGPSTAPVELLVFSDIECPVCRKLHTAMPKILKGYEDKVRVVFKDYPLDRACNSSITEDFHRYSCLGSSFARCAGEQDKFWEALDAIFELDEFESGSQPEEIKAALKERSAALGLDTEAIFQCIDSGRQLEKIRQDIAEGNDLGIKGTPTLYLNGRQVSRISVDGLRAIIEAAIKN